MYLSKIIENKLKASLVVFSENVTPHAFRPPSFYCWRRMVVTFVPVYDGAQFYSH